MFTCLDIRMYVDYSLPPILEGIVLQVLCGSRKLLSCDYEGESECTKKVAKDSGMPIWGRVRHNLQNIAGPGWLARSLHDGRNIFFRHRSHMPT